MKKMSRHKRLLKELGEGLDYSLKCLEKISIALINCNRVQLDRWLTIYDETARKIRLTHMYILTTKEGHVPCEDPYCKICPHSPKWTYDRT